jgi:hypothetical protein
MRKRSQEPIESTHPEAAPGVSPPPPGPLVVHHGPQSLYVPKYGTYRLRELLNLSAWVDAEQLAEDAARTIETLRADPASRPSKDRG